MTMYSITSKINTLLYSSNIRTTGGVCRNPDSFGFLKFVFSLVRLIFFISECSVSGVYRVDLIFSLHQIPPMDPLHFTLIFDLGQSKTF